MLYCSHFTRYYLRSKSFEAFLHSQQAFNDCSMRCLHHFIDQSFYARMKSPGTQRWYMVETVLRTITKSSTLHSISQNTNQHCAFIWFDSWFECISRKNVTFTVNTSLYLGKWNEMKYKTQLNINGLNRTIVMAKGM